MEITFEFWYLLPISILIATIARSSGIGGAVFFSPLFMLVLKLDLKVAVGTALATELFGFASGLIAYYRTKLIDLWVERSSATINYSVPAFGVEIEMMNDSISLASIFVQRGAASP